MGPRRGSIVQYELPADAAPEGPQTASLREGAVMNDVCRHAPDRSIDAGCRHLAVRVIEQAFRDLSGSVGSRADQESARAFLAGSWMLYRWCEIANVSAARTMARASTLDRAFRFKYKPT